MIGGQFPVDPLVEADFSTCPFCDLFTGPSYPIPLTEMCAISLDQLNLVIKHATKSKRLIGGKGWNASGFQNGQMMQTILTVPEAVQLYDVCAHVHAIIPATGAVQVSLVEAMATSAKKTSYFTSHWCLQPRQALLQPTVRYGHLGEQQSCSFDQRRTLLALAATSIDVCSYQCSVSTASQSAGSGSVGMITF